MLVVRSILAATLPLALSGCVRPMSRASDQQLSQQTASFQAPTPVPSLEPTDTPTPAPTDTPTPAATPTSAAVPTAPRSISFAADVAPILARCQPCHFPGGKVYDKLPFDRPETVHQLGTKLFSRVKDEDQQQVIRNFLAQNP
jgi:hypothetical protein